MKALILSLLCLAPTLQSLALADENTGFIECIGNSGTVTVNLTYAVEVGGNIAQFSYVNSTDLAHPWVFQVDPRDIIEAKISNELVKFAHGHHNTLIEMEAAKAAHDLSEGAPYYGALKLQTGNDVPQFETFKVICKKTL